MIKFLRTCKAEIIKQNQSYFKGVAVYITTFVWPVINCLIAYFIYSSFDLIKLQKYGINSFNELLVFVFTGFLSYNSFWLMIQGALYIQRERENGTIEITFLSPSSRFAIVYGRSMGCLTQNFWMFICFFLIIYFVGKNDVGLLNIVNGFIILFISSVIWGGFINSVFLVSRDVDFWLTLCDSPMNLFSGTKFPIASLPQILQCISYVFPLTYCLIIIRKIFSNNIFDIIDLLPLVLCLTVVVFITGVILYIAEKINRKTGNLQLY